jgi:citrate lyase beta subunit
MRHFRYIDDSELLSLFHRGPASMTIDSPPHLLAAALGGTLYCPGTRPAIVRDVRKQGRHGCFSMVLCLEDSIADSAVPFAEQNVADALRELADGQLAERGGPDADALPLLFVRVRSAEQMLRVAELSGDGLDLLSGFVIPKFQNDDGYADEFFDALHRLHRDRDQSGADGRRRLRVMPILESPSMIHSETRTASLAAIVEVIRAHRDDVLALRIGATDLASAYGLRRSRDLTVYDVKLVSAVIADIVNVFGRPEDDFVISGPVWEHYDTTERILRPQLRLTPFADAKEQKLRKRLMLKGLDGLIREISLDQANGLLGKTVIHPAHVPVVHALSVVSHEEYLDARSILADEGGGAAASPYRNKMNEMKPHRAWATKTLLRAEAFGVSAESTTFVDLLEASMR